MATIAPSAGLGRLIAASGLSNLADGVFQMALPLVALGITRDPSAFAAVTVVGRLPWLLFALPAGALADRLDRRRTMVSVDGARAVVIGALAALVLGGLDTMWPLYTAAFALGIAETLFDTAAQSIVPNIVADPDRLSSANGRLYATELTANQFVGPPLGAIVAGASLTAALVTSSASYLLAGAVLVTLSGRYRPVRVGPPTRLRTDVAEGVRYLFGHPLLRTLGICVGISNLASTAMISVLPLYVIAPGPVGLNEAGYGMLLTSIAVGSVAGTAVSARIERRLGLRRTLLVTAASFPLFGLAPALTSSWAWLAVSFTLTGMIAVSWNILTVSLRQRIVPDHLLGRVNAGYRLLAWGTMPLGALLGGAVAEAFGLVAAFWAAAAVSAVCVPVVLFGAAPHLDGADGVTDALRGPGLPR